MWIGNTDKICFIILAHHRYHEFSFVRNDDSGHNHIVYCSCVQNSSCRHLDLNQELFWFYPSFSKASSDMPTILWTVIIIIRMTPSTIPWDHCRTVGGFRTSSPRTRGGNYISWSSGLYHKVCIQRPKTFHFTALETSLYDRLLNTVR